MDIKVPAMGESVTEGTLANWLVKPGQAVKQDDPIAEIETDKVAVEVPAPAAGVISETLVKEGLNLQKKTQGLAEDKISEVTGKMSAMADNVTAKAGQNWDKLEAIFEARTAKAMGKLGVPTAKDVDALVKRVDALAAAVAKLSKAAPAKAPRAAKTAKAAPAKAKPAAKAPVRRARKAAAA